MHRWTGLRRQHSSSSSSSSFPVSFFTAASYSYAHRSTAGVAAAGFSDSSRSRPPRKSGQAGGNGAGGPATTATATTSKSETASTSSGATTDTDGPVKAKDSAAAAGTSPSSNGPTSTTRGRTSRNQGSARSNNTQGTSAPSSHTHTQTQTWTPQTFLLLPFLHAHPAQITQDAFYAGHRPLLQVSVPNRSRQSPSLKDRKVLEIVGEEAQAQGRARAEHAGSTWFDEDEPGQWDAYLVTEPEGSDPRWGEAAEHYLAGLQHHVAPPVPSSSSCSSSASTSPSSRKSPSQRRQNIDFLFPIQAEQRALEEQARKYAEEANITQPARLPESKLKPYRPHSSSNNSFHNHPESVTTTSGDLHSNTAGVRFLLSHLVKNQWSGMWDFERVAKALQAALSKLEKKRAAGKVVNAEGESAVSAQVAALKVKSTANTSTSKSLDELSSASRHQARLRVKAAKRAGTSSKRGRKGTLERMLTEALEESGARIAVFSFNEDGQPVRLPGSNGSPAGEKAKGGRTMSREDREAFKQEVERVVNQVNRFQGFFDKSIELDQVADERGKSSSSATSSEARSAADAALERLEARFGGSRLGSSSSSSSPFQPEDGEAIVSVEVSFDSPSSSSASSPSATRIVDDPSELDWVSSSLPSQEVIDARHNNANNIAMGPRLSQSVRGRSLRPTLRDRLSMRGVGLEETGPVGEEHLPVFFDSVKRKRRKRISKHKYKKRRKANRAERRRTGK